MNPIQQFGTTLVEVLIALVILSTSMLTMLTLFTESITAFSNLTYQQRAIRIASDISETLTGLPTELVRNPPRPGNGECDNNHACSPTEWLANNLYRWQLRAQEQLPNGHIEIGANADEPDTKTNIQVTWTHRNGQMLTYALQQEMMPGA